MKPGFHPRLVNGPFEDPALFVRIPREKQAIQFDLGDISKLAPGEIYRIAHAFVTHTHIDHFIGFDLVLRAVLRRETPLHIYGPPNIIACVEGKLKGYAWNLITDYPAVIHASAFNGKTVARAVFRAAHRFRKEMTGVTPSDGVLLRDPLFRVRAVKMDHDTPSLAYSLEEECQINIDKDALLKRGLSVGPWLSEFKSILREAPGESGREVMVQGAAHSVGQLAGIARITKGQKLVYATDIAMTRSNLKRLTLLAAEADHFFCEAYFLEKDRDRALQRFHLTAKSAGAIAREAAVRRLTVIHISPKYIDCPDAVINEAMTEFNG